MFSLSYQTPFHRNKIHHWKLYLYISHVIVQLIIIFLLFGDVLNKICKGDVTAEALLDSEDFDATISNTNILIHIGRV